ncbi:MAG TPA: hypothetical protein PK765_07640 [bacterium]|nr:hypothetical protein [bacterium]
MAKQLAKRHFRSFSRTVFRTIEASRLYRSLASKPVFIRIALALPIFLFGIIAWLTPIPGGVVILVLSAAMLFPMRTVRSWVARMMHRSRILSLYAWWLRRRHGNRNRSTK